MDHRRPQNRGTHRRRKDRLPQRQRPTAVEALDKAADAVVLGGEAVVLNEVLKDALRRQAGGELRLDDHPIWFAQTGRFRPGWGHLQADGRLVFGWPILNTT